MKTFKLLLTTSLHLLFQSHRFLICFVTLFLMTLASALILSADVLDRTEDLERKEKILIQNNTAVHLWALEGYQKIYLPPDSDEIFFRIYKPDNNKNFFQRNIASLYHSLGLDMIVNLIISLMAIVLSYDSISGKKESGLLRMIHSSSTPRWAFIISEICSVVLVVSISLLFMLVVHTMIAMFYCGIEVDQLLFLQLATFYGAAVLYGCIFTTIGVFFSSMSTKSISSIIKLLAVFTFLVFLLPNIAPLISSWISPIPSDLVASSKIYVERDSYSEQAHADAKSKLEKEFGLVPGSFDEVVDTKWGEESALNEQRHLELKKKWKKGRRRIISNSSAIYDRLRKEFKQEEERTKNLQRNIRDNIALASPVASMNFIVAEISGQNNAEKARLKVQAKAYNRVVSEKLIDENWYKLDEYESNMKSFDLSGITGFRYRPEAFTTKLERTLPYFAHLSIYFLIFLIASVIAYNRYDIR